MPVQVPFVRHCTSTYQQDKSFDLIYNKNDELKWVRRSCYYVLFVIYINSSYAML